MASLGVEDEKVSSEITNSPNFSGISFDKLKKTSTEDVPLNTPWTFWLDKAIPGLTAAQYEASLKNIYKVDTVQSFWAVYHNIPLADELTVRYSYHLMRGSRRPVWEEPENQRGGTWRIKCLKKDTNRVWKELLLAAIGEQLSESLAAGDEICGVTVSIRERDDLVQVWNTDAASAPDGKVFQKLRQLLPDVVFPAQFYKPHQNHLAYEGGKGRH